MAELAAVARLLDPTGGQARVRRHEVVDEAAAAGVELLGRDALAPFDLATAFEVLAP